MSGDASFDVVVVGAGPAGSTAAALLAKSGARVVVLEKEEFPRFHIGESLLPTGLSVLERLDVEPIEETFVYKRGAEFVCEESDRRRTFAFEEAIDGVARHAWHVERASFDTALRDRAVANGADVRHGERVTDVTISADEVLVATGRNAVRGRFLVDATGQDRLLANRNDAVESIETFGKAAVFTHFAGISDEAWGEIGPEFDIRIMLRPEGWGWIIPLPGRRLSVGIVTRERAAPSLLDEGLLSAPLATRWTRGAERLQTRVVRNFSYRNSAPAGPRFASIGDAACFLDPVFSSGVTLALVSAASLADRLSAALDAGTEADADLLAAHGATMERGYATFSALIDRFYNTRFAESFFLGDVSSVANATIRRGVVSVLAGDVWRQGNSFQNMLLGARRRPRGEAAG